MYFMLITKNLTADIGYISGSIAHMAFRRERKNRGEETGRDRRDCYSGKQDV